MTKPFLGPDTPVSFNDLISDVRTVWDKDKIRHNTADDYGLEAQGYTYCGGTFGTTPEGKRGWQSLYVKLRSAVTKELKPRMCEGQIGSFRLVRSGDKTCVRWICTDRLMISNVTGGPVTDIPTELEPFAK